MYIKYQQINTYKSLSMEAFSLVPSTKQIPARPKLAVRFPAHNHHLYLLLPPRTTFMCLFMVKGPVKRVRRRHELAQLHSGCSGIHFTDFCLTGGFSRNDCDRQVTHEQSHQLGSSGHVSAGEIE